MSLYFWENSRFHLLYFFKAVLSLYIAFWILELAHQFHKNCGILFVVYKTTLKSSIYTKRWYLYKRNEHILKLNTKKKSTNPA